MPPQHEMCSGLSYFQAVISDIRVLVCCAALPQNTQIQIQKPTQDEMRSGLSYFQAVIFDIVPIFHRRIDTALANLCTQHYLTGGKPAT